MWQNMIVAVLVLSWGIGLLILGFQANAKGKAYLRRLPPVKGVPLDMYGYDDWLRGWHGPVWWAYRQPQADAELERLRQEARRRARHVQFWMFGFPASSVGLFALVAATGYLR